MSAGIDLLAFAEVEKLSTKWHRKAHKHGSNILDAEGPARTKRASLAARRQEFLVRSKTTEEEQKERDAKQKRAAAHVMKALKHQAESQVHSRPLRRFGVNLSVMMIQHTYHCKTKKSAATSTVTRRQVVMPDNIKWDKFPSWVGTVLGVSAEQAKTAFQYFYLSNAGAKNAIDSKVKLMGWLDTMWMCHPPTLLVYEIGALIDEAEDRNNSIREIFDEFDVDKSGTLSPAEVTQMVMEMDLESAGVTKDDIAHYVVSEFEAADMDKNNSIDFEEFVKYYNGLQDFLKDKLTIDSRSTHVHTKYREEYIEAKSLQVEFEELVLEKNGELELDAHSHNYGIILHFERACLTDSNRTEWVRSETILPQQTDHFTDQTGKCDKLFSPAVLVEFSNEVEMEGSYTVTVPHCFAEHQHSEYGETVPLCKDDMVVCFGTFHGEHANEWYEIAPGNYEILPPQPNPTYGTEFGRVRVTMYSGGIVAVFNRNDRKAVQRVQALAYLPAKMIPIELQQICVHVCPALPDALESIRVEEEIDRGGVTLGGRSRVFELREGTAVELKVSGACGDLYGTESLSWFNEKRSATFDFDPDDLRKDCQKYTPDLAAVVASSVHAHREKMRNERPPDEVFQSILEGKLKIDIECVDMLTRRRGLRKLVNVPDAKHHFLAEVAVHDFPPPSAPSNLKLVSRTVTAIQVSWDIPASWGGCALDRYEVECREISRKGTVGEWAKFPPTPKITFSIAKNVYEGEVRVRSFNIGSSQPSEWSSILHVLPEKEEMKIKAGVKDVDKVDVESGIAVITSEGLDGMLNVKHKIVGAAYMEKHDWSDFQTAIGEFFIESGVHGGVTGTLFDLTPSQVEALVLGSDGEAECDGLEEDKPLLSLANAAVWVLQTLAHHTQEADEWIVFMNEISGLVSLAAEVAEEGATKPILKSLLFGLIDIFQTLQQCEETGYITQQLSHKYDKALKKLLKQDWEMHRARLKVGVATSVMSLVLYERFKQHGLAKLMHDKGKNVDGGRRSSTRQSIRAQQVEMAEEDEERGLLQ